MEFSVFLMGDASATYDDMVEEVALAEELGFHGAWLGERHFANGDLLWPSPMVAASFIAARTSRIRVGLAARILPFHHPLHVAADALTLDVLSGGRCDLGLSRASMDDASHEAFGVSRDEARRRFDEQYEVLRLACRGEPFSFQGRYFALNEVTPNPRPVQRPHMPIFMVANSASSLEDAACRGLPIFAHGALDLQGAAQTVDRYDTLSAQAGHRTGTGVLLNRFVFVGRTNDEAHRLMREPFMRFLHERAPDLKAYLARTFGERGTSYDFLAREICIFGDADHCTSRLEELRERARVDRFLLTFNLITLDHRSCIESLRRFALDVMTRTVPAFPMLGWRRAPMLSRPENLT